MKSKISVTVDLNEVGHVLSLLIKYKPKVQMVEEDQTKVGQRLITAAKEAVQIARKPVETFEQAKNGHYHRPNISQVRSDNGTPVSETHRGRIIMSVFKTLPIARGADLSEAVMKAGYSGNSWSGFVHNLMKEGVVIRLKRGVYRAAPRGMPADDGGDRCRTMSG